MQVVDNQITLVDLKKMAQEMFGDMVKAVVDIEKEIMAINGELHSDEEALLIQKGSKQENLWGINLYPEITGDDWVEFNSMINLRPSVKNLSRGVENPDTRKKILTIVNKLVKK